jgi:hypothetical protein
MGKLEKKSDTVNDSPVKEFVTAVGDCIDGGGGGGGGGQPCRPPPFNILVSPHINRAVRPIIKAIRKKRFNILFVVGGGRLVFVPMFVFAVGILGVVVFFPR